MADKKHEMKLEVTEESKVIEVPKFQVSVFESLLKNIKRYCKYLKLPQPEVKELGTKSYYALTRRYPDGTTSTLKGTITDNYDEIKKNREDRTDSNGFNSYSIISQEVEVYEINIIEEVKPDNDWEIQGVIDHTEGIITSAPNKQVPFKLIPSNLNDSTHCDHCNTKRFRNKTIFVKNTDTNDIKRVGGSCIRYYLGYDYERILKIITTLNLFNQTFSTSGGWGDEDWYDGFGGRRYYDPEDDVVDVKDVVKYFFWFVQNKGYTSKSAADKWNEKNGSNGKEKSSTSQNLYEYLRYIYVPPTPGHSNDAKEAMDRWMNDNNKFHEILKKAPTEFFKIMKKFIDERYKDNNFLVNTRNFFNNGSVKIKHIKYIVSACSMYWGMKLAEDRKNEKTKEYKKSEFVGQVGEKTPLENLTIQNISGFEGSFGWTSIYRMTDSKGNIYTKFGTINPRFITKDSPVTDIEKGAVVSFTAEIKKHDTYKDIKQTTLGRLSKI